MGQYLGGASTHASKSGVCHLTSADDKTCIAQVRELLSFLPSNNQEDPPFKATNDPGAREGGKGEDRRRRIAPGVGDEVGAPEDVPVELREAVDGVGEQIRREVLLQMRGLPKDLYSARLGILRGPPVNDRTVSLSVIGQPVDAEGSFV